MSEVYESKLVGDDIYSLVWLKLGERQYHRPTLQELEQLVVVKKMQEAIRK